MCTASDPYKTIAECSATIGYVEAIPDRGELGGPAAYAAYKRKLIGSLEGTVLEIGAGRGANFGSLHRAGHWIGVEPSRRRRAALRRTAAHRTALRGTDVLDGRAEQLPIEDASVDAVLSTIVLCSVRDQAAALAEVRRVLRPGGRFVFFEHVAAAPGTGSHRAQRVWAPISRTFDHGCDPTRRTWESLRECGLSELRLRWFEFREVFGLRVPYIGGEAVKG